VGAEWNSAIWIGFPVPTAASSFFVLLPSKSFMVNV
jgi:hypothetical protein